MKTLTYSLLSSLILITSLVTLSYAEPKGSKVIEFKQLNLQGTIQRPSASFFMGRRKLKFKGLIPKKSFIKEIKASVRKPPF